MVKKAAVVSTSCDRLETQLGTSPWFALMHKLRAAPEQFIFLDAAQLVKHAFALLKKFGTKHVKLVYLFWEPMNKDQWGECRKHREEALELAERVAESNVRLVPTSYHELWPELEAVAEPSQMKYLKRGTRAV